MPSRLTSAALVGGLLLSGCAQQTGLYYWGDYESVLLRYYTKPGDMTASRMAASLQTLVDEADRAGQPVAPGILVQLGVALADLGDQTGAEAAFAREMALYPESKTFVMGMVQRARQAKAGDRSPADTGVAR
jgi:hypothetical protein